uniref:Protein kinase domain-containing protein n=1 Tax=Meloidogyne incognita TaxID=6306 RepID=A0A914LBI3_MELIC
MPLSSNWLLFPPEKILDKIGGGGFGIVYQGVIRLVDWFSSKNGFIIIMERPKNFMARLKSMNN